MNKIVKLKRVFLENNSFQSHESHQLSTNIQISAHPFIHEYQWNRVIVQENNHNRVIVRLKDKVKT